MDGVGVMSYGEEYLCLICIKGDGNLYDTIHGVAESSYACRLDERVLMYNILPTLENMSGSFSPPQTKIMVAPWRIHCNICT